MLLRRAANLCAMSVALVTDSTASLPAETVAERGITVVPLQVVIGATAYDEGVDTGDGGGVTPQMLADALKEWTPVSTSRPNPEAILEVYEKLAAEGADEIVSVHISSELSGTFESAQLAARRSSVPVTPVDSRQVGMGTGFAVLAAADAIDDGADAAAGGARPPGPGRPTRPRSSTSTPWSTSAAAAAWAPPLPCSAPRSRSSRS